MSRRFAPVFTLKIACALLLSNLSVGLAVAATGNCSSLGQLPAALSVGEGLQQELQSPVAITRLAIGDPKVADVHLNGDRGFLLTGVAPGTTSLMVWTACSTTPRQSLVFVKGKATSALTSLALSPSDDPLLPSQVQTDIRFVEVSRTKLKEASTSIFGRGGNFLFGSPSNVANPVGTAFRNNLPVNGDTFNIGFGGGRISAMINALESSGFAYTLARPSLVALSGQSASFLAGGEVPIPVPSSGSNTTSISKFPGLGDIPVLGAFFRDSNINRQDKELLMIVTPHLVQPLAANAKLPSLPGENLRNYDPNWYRLYFLENGNFDRSNGLSQ